jgi:hypothetical protein
MPSRRCCCHDEESLVAVAEFATDEFQIESSFGQWFDSDQRSKEKSPILSMLKKFVEEIEPPLLAEHDFESLARYCKRMMLPARRAD